MHDNLRPLLYLSPVIPSVGGNGLAMRAGAVLRVLARSHAVALVVMPLYPPRRGRLPPALAELCERVAMLRPPGQGPGPLKRLLSRLVGERQEPAQPALPFQDRRFEVIHVFRLSMVDAAHRYAAALAARDPEIHLDLDDVESDLLHGLAQLHRANGRVAAAEAASRAAHAAWTLENDALASFDRIYVCSDSDRARLAPRSRAQLCVLPNMVQLPLGPVSVRDGVFQFLFVGTLGYPPNDDAVVYFCAEIVPRIERLTRRDFRVVIAGGGASGRLRRLARPPRITFAGWVPHLAPLYRRTGAAVVPIRAGGGTRIKVLEAFSYRCPVVTTSQGIAGIEARHDEHVLIGDTPEDFAGCCARLIENAALGRRLTEAAFALARQVYSVEAVAAALEAMPRPVRVRAADAWPAAPDSGRT